MNANGKITAPVNTDDVRNVLGVASDDVGYLCSNAHKQINPFAMFKPVRINNPDSVADFWKGLDGNCGFEPYQLSDISDIVNHCDGSMNGWKYLAPNSSYYFRLTDFDGYNHNAVHPLRGGAIVPKKIWSDDTLSIGFPWMKGSDTIGFGDIALTKDTYWCYYLKRASGSGGIHGTSERKASDESGDIVDIDIRGIANRIGTWKLYICLSTAKYSFNDVKVSTYYTIPYVEPLDIVIEDKAGKVVITCTTTRVSGSTATFKIKVKNNTLSPISFKNNSWQLRIRGVSESDTLKITENFGSLEDFTLAADATKEITLTASADCVQTGADLIINLQSGAYKHRAPVENLTPTYPE